MTLAALWIALMAVASYLAYSSTMAKSCIQALTKRIEQLDRDRMNDHQSILDLTKRLELVRGAHSDAIGLLDKTISDNRNLESEQRRALASQCHSTHNQG